MSWLFSKRCQIALKKEKLRVSIPQPVRYRLLRTLQNYNEAYYETTHTGWNNETSILQELESKLKAEIGCKDLFAFPESGAGQAEPSNLEGVILRGNYPPYLLDALELFYQMISQEQSIKFQSGVNSIFEESALPWRMAEGKIFPIDSAYAEEDILRKAQYLLKDVKFHGALEEFEKARTDLANGDYKDAIDNANMAVESTMKAILKIDKAKPGQLFRKMIDSGLIPEYFEGFLKCFEEQILRCTAIVRNEELGVGHGQGAKINKIPPALAELAVHLSGVLIIFLIKRHIDRK